jgi:hypothetical protein
VRGGQGAALQPRPEALRHQFDGLGHGGCRDHVFTVG